MAERYGKTPTEILNNGTLKDLRYFNVAQRYRVRQQRLADPEEAAKVKAEDLNKKYSQEELQDMIRNVNDANS